MLLAENSFTNGELHNKTNAADTRFIFVPCIQIKYLQFIKRKFITII